MEQNDILTYCGREDRNSLLTVLNKNKEDDFSDNNISISEHIMPTKYFNVDDAITKIISKNNDFSFLSMNIQSLNAKFDQLKILIHYLNDRGCEFSAICIQETWFSDFTDTSLYNINGYNLLSQSKICSAHGGLCIYLNIKYDYKIKPDVYKTSDIWEGQFVEIRCSQCARTFILRNLFYRPPIDLNHNYQTFIDELTPVLNQLNKKNKEVVIAGDFNIDLLRLNEKPIFNDYFDMLITNHFIPTITLPTRLSARSASLLDNFICNSTLSSSPKPSGIIISDLSDHFPYFLLLDTQVVSKPPPKSITIQKFDSHSVQSFKATVASANIYNNLNKEISADPNINYNIIQNTITAAKTKSFPVKTFRYNKHKHKNSQWITQGLIKSIKNRDKLYANLKSLNTGDENYNDLKLNLCTYNKIIKKCIRKAEKIYYYNSFKKYTNDIKSTWGVIKDIVNKNKAKKSFLIFFLN